MGRISECRNILNNVYVTDANRRDVFDTWDASRVNHTIRVELFGDGFGLLTIYVWFDIYNPSPCIREVLKLYDAFAKYEVLEKKVLEMLKELGCGDFEKDGIAVTSFLLTDNFEKYKPFWYL